MAYIEVNHAELNSVATTIDGYVTKVKSNMGRINEEVIALGASWSGEDYDQFKKETAEKIAKGSITERMLTSLSNYADALQDASKQYKEAQARAINRANTLCR